MAYYGGAGSGNVFGGYPGGYNLNPATGAVGGAGAGLLGPGSSGSTYTLGMNLPHVDPNNYSGTVHFGQPSTFVGQGYNVYPGAGGANLGGNAGLGGGNIYPGF